MYDNNGLLIHILLTPTDFFRNKNFPIFYLSHKTMYALLLLLFCCRITQRQAFICQNGVELLVTFHNTICSSDIFFFFVFQTPGRSEKYIGFNDRVLFSSSFLRNHRIFRRRNSLKVLRVAGGVLIGGHFCDFSVGFPRKPLAPENLKYLTHGFCEIVFTRLVLTTPQSVVKTRDRTRPDDQNNIVVVH